MISEAALVIGVGVLSVALRSFSNQALFRLGTLGFVGTSFLAGWLLGGSLVLGGVFASSWFLLPWLEILTRVRRMRLPLHRPLEKCPPPPASQFPDFAEISDGIESAGFEYANDVNWQDGTSRQFYRLFYHTEKRLAGAICLVEQASVAFFYVTFTSHGTDGRIYLTWNFPFSYGMHLLPQTVLNRVADDCDVTELAEAHGRFLASLSVETTALQARDIQTLSTEVEKELRSQLEHNIARGILARDGDQMIRYSVRGMFFLWGQFLREFVRFF
jgi:hypothetical protein